MGGWEAGRLYLTLHCHHKNDSCIKVGSDDSRCNVLFIERGKGKVTRQCLQITTFEKRRTEAESNPEILPFIPAYNALPLGQAGSCIKLPRLSPSSYGAVCETRGGRPGLPVPNKPDGFCGRKATLKTEQNSGAV